MRIILTTTLLCGALLAAASAAAAVEPTAHDRKWGLGWADGLTLRRWVGAWELGVAAGPDDWLTESDTRQWATVEPDSVQGRPYQHGSNRRESGFVRAQAGRALTVREPLALLGQVSLQYRWSDQRHEQEFHHLDSIRYETADRFVKTWTLAAAIRLAWRPVDFLSIETAFGLYYAWEDTDEVHESIRRDLEPPLESDQVTVRQTKESSRQFQDQGWDGLSSLSFIVWF